MVVFGLVVEVFVAGMELELEEHAAGLEHSRPQNSCWDLAPGLEIWHRFLSGEAGEMSMTGTADVVPQLKVDYTAKKRTHYGVCGVGSKTEKEV